VTHCASVLHLLINNVLLSGGGPRDNNTLVAARLPLGKLMAKIESVAKALALGKKTLTVSLDALEEEEVVLADELAVLQVVLNFVSNAVRHALSRVAVALWLKEDAALVIRVEDDGPGVPVEKRASLFSGQPRAAGLKVFRHQSQTVYRRHNSLTPLSLSLSALVTGEWCRTWTGYLPAHGHLAWGLGLV
jgi:K+-sensing histidine kinase KdpD